MKKLFLLLTVAALTFTACSDEYMEKVNTDESKVSKLDPNAQLTTALLQTYGDFSMMDTYRCYITGFAQYFAGGWNVTAHAGSNYYYNDYARKIWDRYYELAIKNLVDGIHNSKGKPNLNAALRIHRVYLASVLADTYGDSPCKQAGLGYLEGISSPKYDTVEELYNWFFEELKACEKQLGTGTDHLTGDVTSMQGEIARWKAYANSLRLRFAMRISDVNHDKAQAEFEAAVNEASGIITRMKTTPTSSILTLPLQNILVLRSTTSVPTLSARFCMVRTSAHPRSSLLRCSISCRIPTTPVCIASYATTTTSSVAR